MEINNVETKDVVECNSRNQLTEIDAKLETEMISLIERYKEYSKLDLNEMSDSFYVWNAIDRFQNRFNIDSPSYRQDFSDGIEMHNGLLKPSTAHATINNIIKNMPDKKLLLNLFDESANLEIRLNEFFNESNCIIKQCRKYEIKDADGKKKWEDQQGIFASSIYLTFYYPEKYYVCTKGIYKKIKKYFQSIVDYDQYSEYLRIMDFVKNNILRKDIELMKVLRGNTRFANMLNSDEKLTEVQMNILMSDIMSFWVDSRASKAKKNKNSVKAKYNPDNSYSKEEFLVKYQKMQDQLSQKLFKTEYKTISRNSPFKITDINDSEVSVEISNGNELNVRMLDMQRYYCTGQTVIHNSSQVIPICEFLKEMKI